MTIPGDSTATTAMTQAQYDRSHPKGMGSSYWHLARNAILWRNLRPELNEACVLDVGCGPGLVVEFLRNRGVECYGVDLGTPEPETRELDPYLFLGKRADELEADFRSRITTLLLMDVLEHLPEPLELLEDLYRDFPNARTVYVTVPARMEVWSAWDEFYGHHRRYTLERLTQLVNDSSYVLDKSAYFFHSLYLAMRVVGALSKQRSTKISSPRFHTVHRALGRLFATEHRAAPRWLGGSSLYAILRRA